MILSDWNEKKNIFLKNIIKNKRAFNFHTTTTTTFIIFTPLRKHIFIYKQIYLLIIPHINFGNSVVILLISNFFFLSPFPIMNMIISIQLQSNKQTK